MVCEKSSFNTIAACIVRCGQKTSVFTEKNDNDKLQWAKQNTLKKTNNILYKKKQKPAKELLYVIFNKAIWLCHIFNNKTL